MSASLVVFLVFLARLGEGIRVRNGPDGLMDGLVGERLLHQPSCEAECHICETMAAPKLLNVRRACPDCACARRIANATASCPAVPSDRFCVQGGAKDDRGCPSRHCAATHVPLGELLANLRSCAKLCAGGYVLDAKSGLPVCSCVCPLEEVAPRHRWEFCSAQCGGGRFTMVQNTLSGCEECLCEEPRPGCPPFACHKYCPNGYVVDDRGCPRCQCQPRDADSKACPIVGCNVDCGPHPMVTVQRGGCVTGCSCRCRAPTDCPQDHLHAGICVERVRDQYGCPTCECARRMDVSLPSNELQTGVSLCPEIAPHPSSPDVCPVKCSTGRFFDGERKCQLCDCCPDFRKKCPDMFCERYQVDHWGCSICACAKPAHH